jgi:hypothetical protein
LTPNLTADIPPIEDKVVYVLGAGFSIPAGAPTQAQILGDILALDTEDLREREAKAGLSSFLELDLRINQAEIGQAALEDIYTPSDRCITDGTSLKSKTVADLTKIRRDLEFLISIAIARRISRHQVRQQEPDRYVNAFAELLVRKAARRAVLAANTQTQAQRSNTTCFRSSRLIGISSSITRGIGRSSNNVR